MYDMFNTEVYMKKEQILSVRAPSDLMQKTMLHAKELDLTASQVVRKLLREWVAEQDKKHKKQLTLQD